MEIILKKISQNNKQRISIIDLNGKVLIDTEKEIQLLNNHANRPEVLMAKNKDIGISTRYSESLNEEALYLAMKISNKDKNLGYLRFSYISSNLKPVLTSYTYKVFWGTLILVLFFSILFNYASREIIQSLNRIRNASQNYSQGNFENLISIDKNDSKEVALLIETINNMARRLNKIFNKIQRQRNERESIFSSMSEGVLSVYMDNNIFHLNNSICDFFKVPYSQNYKGKPIIEVFKNNQIINFIENVKKQKNTLEEEMELPNGKSLVVHGSLLLRPDSTPMGVLMVFNDITEIKKLENHRKDFVANVSHELRTPLTSIQGYAETLLEGVDDPEMRKQFLSTIKRNSERLHTITEDLLSLSEIDRDISSGNIQLEPVETKTLIQNAIGHCQNNADKKQIQLIKNEDENPILYINYRLLDQALVNLIDNAIKYSPENTKIEIFTEVKNNQAHISVKDQGPGIERKHHERLFERFYSANKARSRELGGSGLGLSIVKNIAVAHGGSVKIKSEPGKGSLFSIILPLT